MHSKYSICSILALAAAFASTPIPIGAQRVAKGPPPPPQQGAQSSLPQPPPTRDYSKESDVQRTVLGAYRLTYTLTEMDGTKRLGSQHDAIVLDADAPPARVDLHSNLSVPYGQSANQYPSMVTERIGVVIVAHLRKYANGMELTTQIEQMDLAHSAMDTQTRYIAPPITRESRLSSTALLSENKPVILGQLDTPGSTHSLQIQVELTRLH